MVRLCLYCLPPHVDDNGGDCNKRAKIEELMGKLFTIDEFTFISFSSND